MLQEFRNESGYSVLIYKGFDFMSRVSDDLAEANMSEDALEEVKSVSLRQSALQWHASKIKEIAALNSLNKFTANFGESSLAKHLKEMDSIYKSISANDKFREAMASFQEINDLVKDIELPNFEMPSVDLPNWDLPVLDSLPSFAPGPPNEQGEQNDETDDDQAKEDDDLEDEGGEK